jgi:RNA polymerase sigma factor (sigma-70 family)
MIERSDQEWVRLLKQDDPQAVQDLWILVFTVASSFSRAAKFRYQGVDPADMAHQAAVAAYQKLRRSGIHSFRFECAFRGFCTVVVVRELYRLTRKLPAVTEELDEGLIGNVDVPRLAAAEEQVHARLQVCIDELPERKQHVIRMLYYEELSPQAVADRLAIERNNVNKLAHDARLKLRECLKRHGFGSSNDVLEM